MESWCRDSLQILPLFHGSICLVFALSQGSHLRREGVGLQDVNPMMFPPPFPDFQWLPTSMIGGCYISRVDCKLHVAVVRLGEAVLLAIIESYTVGDLHEEKNALDVLFPWHVLLLSSHTELTKSY